MHSVFMPGSGEWQSGLAGNAVLSSLQRCNACHYQETLTASGPVRAILIFSTARVMVMCSAPDDISLLGSYGRFPGPLRYISPSYATVPQPAPPGSGI